VAVVRDKAHAEWLQYVQNAAGAILSPFDAWLVLRGTKTLALRMPRHEENGRRVAVFLREQKKVRRVYWPGFCDHPGHEIHKKQASGFGALIAFDLGSLEAADRLLRHVRLCSLGESLGGIETLISHPATMTHAGYTPAEREALGIGDGLVRIASAAGAQISSLTCRGPWTRFDGATLASTPDTAGRLDRHRDHPELRKRAALRSLPQRLEPLAARLTTSALRRYAQLTLPTVDRVMGRGWRRRAPLDHPPGVRSPSSVVAIVHSTTTALTAAHSTTAFHCAAVRGTRTAVPGGPRTFARWASPHLGGVTVT
jgi:hypothetical protein